MEPPVMNDRDDDWEPDCGHDWGRDLRQLLYLGLLYGLVALIAVPLFVLMLPAVLYEDVGVRAWITRSPWRRRVYNGYLKRWQQAGRIVPRLDAWLQQRLHLEE
jgi:hypothetical protein